MFKSSKAGAVDKTRNMEHLGTSNNYHNYEKKMCETKCSAQIGHMTLFFFSRAEQLLRNDCVRKNFPPWEINWKVYEVTDCWWYLEWRRECFNRVIPRKFLSEGSKYKVSGFTVSNLAYVDLLSNGRKSLLQLGVNRKDWQVQLLIKWRPSRTYKAIEKISRRRP